MLRLIIVLSLVQGLTEFLPISSSGHMGLIQAIWGVALPGLFFEALVHLGTLLSVLWVFRREVGLILAALVQPGRAEHRRTPWLILVGTVPTAIFGLLLDPWLEEAFSSPLVIGSGLIFTGVILLFAERQAARSTRPKRGLREVAIWEALAIGVAQGLAILPGISRSGATIGLGLILGLERTVAAEFSFLLAIPAILGAVVLKGWEAWHAQTSYAGLGLVGPYLLGMALAAISGALAIKYLLRVLRRGRLIPFAYYCGLLGIGAIVFALALAQER